MGDLQQCFSIIDIHAPYVRKNKECREYERICKIYDIFYANLHRLQFGDTFSIQAALINQ